MNHDFIYGMFTGKDVFVVGSGGSLYGFDYSILKGRAVIAVNHAYRFTDHNLLVFYDCGFPRESGFWAHSHHTKVLAGNNAGVRPIGNVGNFKRSVTVTERIEYGLYMGCSYAINGQFIPAPSSSTLPAINAALIGGASRVFLLGCDGKYLSKEETSQAWAINGNTPESFVMPGEYMHHASQGQCNHKRKGKDEESLFISGARWFTAYKHYPVFNLSTFSIIDLPKLNLQDVT